MMMAQAQHASVGLAWTCFFVEQDPDSATALDGVVAQYVAAGVAATAHHGDVLDVLDGVLAAAVDCPLFVFLDPCSLGIPFDRLAGRSMAMVTRAGDQLVVTKLDRLGRSEAPQRARRILQQRQIDLVVLDQGVDSSTAVGRMFFQILGAISEFEHALMSKRTLDGLRGRPQLRPHRRSEAQALTASSQARTADV